MELINNIILNKKSIFLKKEKTLIIGDVHIGLEGEMKKQGIIIPLFQYSDLKKEVLELINNLKPKTIILNGDVKHNFGTVSKDEWKHTIDFIETINKHSKIIIIEGNHDKLLELISKKKSIELKSYHKINDVYITHGDKIPEDEDFKLSKTVIIGHEHPSVSLRMEGRQETYKCFLKGTFENKDLIVMPSMHELSEGTDLLKDEVLSPFLKNNIKECDVYIVGEEPLHFGKLKDLIKVS